MRVKKLLAGILAAAQLTMLAPLTHAEGVADLASSKLAAGFFTSSGLMDSSSFAVDKAYYPTSTGNNNIAYNTVLNRYEAKTGTDDGNFYSIRMPAGRRNSITSAGYTVEAYFTADSITTDAGVFDCAYGGGFAIEITKDKELDILLRSGSDYINNGSVRPGRSVVLETGKYYHVAATVDASSVKVYVNGELKETVAKGGTIAWPSATILNDVRYGAHVGGQYSNSVFNTLTKPLDGKVVFTNLYSKPLTADEVTAAYGDIEARKTLTKVDDLQVALDTTIPTKIKEGQSAGSLYALQKEGQMLMGKAGLTDAEITTYLDKVTAFSGTEAKSPVVYDSKTMTYKDGSPVPTNTALPQHEIEAYGILANPIDIIWSLLKYPDTSASAVNEEAMRYSMRSFTAVQAKLTPVEYDFTKDTRNNWKPLTDGRYVYESEVALNARAAGPVHLKFFGLDSAGKKQAFTDIQFLRTTTTNTKPFPGKVYAADASGTKLESSNEIAVSLCSKTEETNPGQLFYIKAIFDFETNTYSAWIVPRKQTGGTYEEKPVTDADLIVKDAPMNVSGIKQFTGFAYQYEKATSGSALAIKNVKVTPDVYALTGTTDANVNAIYLKQSGETKYTAVIDSTTATFADVKPGTYDVAIDYKSGYQATGTTTTNVTVPGDNLSSLNFTSETIPSTAFTISGTVDAGIQSVTLKNGDTIVATGIITDGVLTFGKKIENGTYTLLVTYKTNYASPENFDGTVTVNGADITNIALTSVKTTITVSGTVNEHVTSVILKQDDAVKYTGVIAGGTVTFTDIAKGTYTMDVKFDQNYTLPENTDLTLTVTADKNDLNIGATAPADGITLRLAVLSDFQYGRTSQNGNLSNLEYASKKTQDALDQVISKAGGVDKLDVLLVPGDITHNSKPEEYQAFVADIKAKIPAGSHTKVLFVRGNHDAKPGSEQNFVNELKKYDASLSSPNQSVNVNGYEFVIISQDTQKQNDESSSYPYIYSPQTLAWFTKAMDDAAAKSDGKPIFVGMHPNIKDTVYGSFPVNGSRGGKPATSAYWGTTENLAGLTGHSNAITFSGHSHWDIANERSIHQGDFTSLGTGAVNNLEIEDCWDEKFQPKRFGNSEQESSGYYMEVKVDQTVETHRLDLFRKSEFKTPWVIDVNDKENWPYTDARDNDLPYFEQDATIRVENIGSKNCKVTFSQAKDDTTDVGIYNVEMVNQATQEVDAKFTVSSYYWQGADAPKENYWDVTGLFPSTEYVAKVTPLDSYYKAGDTPLVSEPFTTLTREAVTFADIAFTANGAVDASPFAKFTGTSPIAYGKFASEDAAGKPTFNSDLNLYEASFERNSADTNSPDFFKVPIDSQRMALMQTGEGYTIDLLFKPTTLNTSNNIIGAAQSAGFDLETDDVGVFSAYVRHNGAWVKDPYPGNSLSVTSNTYYHVTVTYDGKNVRVYNDGVLLDTVAATGAIEFSDIMKADAHYGMVIGGDYNPTKDGEAYIAQTLAQNAFSGSIAGVKMYNTALTQSEVTKLHTSFETRKELLKVGDLNTMLTETLPAARTDENAVYVDKLLNEGWLLMAKTNVTDAEITAFLAKAEVTDKVQSPYVFDAKTVKYTANDKGDKIIPYREYGITADQSGTVWSVIKENASGSLFTDAVRFTTRNSIGDKDLMSIDFAKDTINNPDGLLFNGKSYTIETEFSVLHKNTGYVAIEPKAGENVFASLRFDTATSKAFLVDSDGIAIGKQIPVALKNSNNSNPSQLFYVKFDVDMQNHTYSAWLVTRKTDSTPYNSALPTDSNLLAANVPFAAAAATATQLTGLTTRITGSAETNGVWINNIIVTGDMTAEVIDPDPTEFEATIQIDTDALAANGTAPVTVSVINPKEENKTLVVYCATYKDGTLHSIKAIEKEITAKEDTISSTLDMEKDQGLSAKIFVWDNQMNPYALKSI